MQLLSLQVASTHFQLRCGADKKVSHACLHVTWSLALQFSQLFQGQLYLASCGLVTSNARQGCE